MKNFDLNEISYIPSNRRTNGGVRGFEKNLVCQGLFGFGTTESSSNQTEFNLQGTAQGGGAGSTTIVTGAQSSTRDINIQSLDPAVVDSAFQFGAESQTIAAQQVGQGNQTIQYLSGMLASIVGNAAPQSDAAKSEILAGTSPLAGGSVLVSLESKIVPAIVIGGGLLTAYFIWKNR